MSRRTFADMYRSMVAPKLREMCRAQGALVTLSLTGFAEAYWDVMHAAARLGASHLPSDILLELEATITEWLLEAAAEIEPAFRESRLSAFRAAAQYDAHERRWLH